MSQHDRAFDPRALAATYEAAGELPDGLLRRVLRVRGGSLSDRAEALRAVRRDLLAGRSVSLPAALFEPAIAARGAAFVRTLAPPRTPSGGIDAAIVDELLGDLLEASAASVVDQHEVAALLARLRENAAREERHLDDDQIARALAERSAERADEAMMAITPRWAERARLWGAVRGVYGDLGEGLGTGWDLGTAALTHAGWTQVPALHALLQRSPELVAIVRALGRLHEARDGGSVAARVHRPLRRSHDETPARDRRVPSETRGIERSDALSRMLPAESALLRNRTLRKLFHARRAEHALATYLVEGVGVAGPPSPAGPDAGASEGARERGPIIALLDTSASMSGAPESVAKAVVLEALRVAHAEGRLCFLIAFGGPDDVVELALSLDRPGVASLLDFLALSFRGGTDTAEPLRRALALLAREDAENADVLLVSDGAFAAPRDLSPALAEQRARGTRFHGLIVGPSESPAMSAICDPLHRFASWKLDSPPSDAP